MSYIGSTPTTQSFIAGTDYFNGTGSQVAFTLSRPVNSVNDIEVIVNNVEQIPSGYSVSGTTLTFSAAPSAGTSNVYVRYLSTTNLSLAIPSGTSATFNTVGVTGNLNFTGTGNRITGDFSNATIANRVLFQTSTSNSSTALGVIPNGTGSVGQINLFTSSDPANSSVLSILAAASLTESRFQAGFTGTGTYLPITFYTGGSERVRVDTSGNVGIGTSSPNAKVEILKTSSGAVVTQLFLHNASDADGTGARLDFAGLTDGTIPTASISNIRTGAGTYALTFNNFGGGSNTERARIDSSGNLLVGCTSLPGGGTTGTAFQLGASISGMCTWTNRSSTTAASDHAYFYNPNGIVGFIRTTNSATSYSTSSDYRLKENVAPMTGALATVAALKPVTYKWKVDGSDGQGFIAHELQEVVPDCVHGEKDAVDAEGNPQYQGIDTSFLVATLTAAIQEQQALITALTTRITALEAK
jgi:hypothetical protein